MDRSKTDQRANSSKTTPMRATDTSEQHAIDAWESEGGRQSSAPSGPDLAGTALTNKTGWRASHNVGWRADDPYPMRQR